MNKLVALDGYALHPEDLFWDDITDEVDEFKIYARTPRDQIAERIGDANLVITNKAVITREVMEACPNIRWIGILATGFNVVDIEAAKERGIMVANVPGYSTDSVAQLAFSLILELCNGAGQNSVQVHKGKWTTSDDFSKWGTPQVELKDLMLGVVGFGAIGSRVAEIGRAFGMKVIAYNRSAKKAEGVEFVSLEQLYKSSDIISLHVPINPETEKMINEKTLAMMKPNTFIINTARGGLVDEMALRKALDSGAIAGAGLDVLSVEPVLPDNPMLGAKNCVLTPHLGWTTGAARGRLMKVVAENLRSFLEGRAQNIVNL